MIDELRHCCAHMDEYTVSQEHDCIIKYYSYKRSYTFPLYKDGKLAVMEKLLWYCPWCGKKLPEDVGEAWEEVLKNEYGITVHDFFNKQGRWDESKVPEELRTDEWWKKRNL